jgi:hypothetical protein
MARFFSVKNYEAFQHYKDRSPPWIKFYNSVLDDYNFTCLPDASRSHLVAIWLLASRTDNRIPYDAEWVRMAIKATSPVNLSELEKAGFIATIQDRSEPLADCKQDARPEGEKRQSRDREENIDSDANASGAVAPCSAEVLEPEEPANPRATIFREGLRWLSKTSGVPETKLRSRVGKWIKARGDPDVCAAIVAAQQANIVQPLDWIEKRLQGNAQRKPSDFDRREELASAFRFVANESQRRQ